MKTFHVGAQRPATQDARLTAAHDLVQRTLAQHGLVPGPKDNQGGLTMPNLGTFLAGWQTRQEIPADASDGLPPGATFRRGHFRCAAGERGFRTYVPSSAASGAQGIVVMLHGCTQTPEDFAAGTGMNALADLHGFVVVYPAQARGNNAQSCWNWFSRGDQRRDRGEPAIIAGITREVAAEFGVPPAKTFVAGLSAGAAMAVILGQTYPDVFAAVGAHSGLPYGAAKDVPSAFAAMGGNAAAPTRPSRGDPAVRTFVIHGTADATVHPSNGTRIAQDRRDVMAGQTIETATRITTQGRAFTQATATDRAGLVILEEWTVEGLGHAWSGGRAAGSYTDPQGPDASAGMIRFFFETPQKAE